MNEEQEDLKNKIIQSIKANGVIPVLSHNDVDSALHAVNIAYQNGIRVIELRYQRNSFFLRYLTSLKKEVAMWDDSLYIGVGFISDVKDAEKCILAGADFVASPLLHTATAKKCENNNILWIPACNSFAEVALAKSLGARIVTVQPGRISVQEFIKQLCVDVPSIYYIPSHSMLVNEKSWHIWFEAGALCVRLEDVFFPKVWLNTGNWRALEKHIRHVLQRIQPCILENVYDGSN